ACRRPAARARCDAGFSSRSSSTCRADSSGERARLQGFSRAFARSRPELLHRARAPLSESDADVSIGRVPELPDVTVYVEGLEKRIGGTTLERVRLASPFLLRSVDPPLRALEGRSVAGVRRIGKRIVIALEGELFLVIHLMIAGRLRWRERGAAV